MGGPAGTWGGGIGQRVRVLRGAASASLALSRCRDGETLDRAADNLVLPEGPFKNDSQCDLVGWAGQQGSM